MPTLTVIGSITLTEGDFENLRDLGKLTAYLDTPARSSADERPQERYVELFYTEPEQDSEESPSNG